MPDSVGSPGLWSCFAALVAAALWLDLGVLQRRHPEMGFRLALLSSIGWVALAAGFGGWVFHRFGKVPAMEFFGGYLVELSLSVDNLFVFLVIFSYFSCPAPLQRRVLFWGILGAVVFRGVFIFAGTAFLERFSWGIYVFGAILVATALKLLLAGEGEAHPERNPVLRLVERLLPVANEFHGEHFLVRKGGRRFATRMLLVLVVVETTDIVFAVDSIPAIFGITKDPFIVLTSNIFAVMGLRSFYFLLAGMMNRFHYLKAGLGAVLLFIGVKMLIEHYVQIPIQASLAVIAGILGLSVAASFLWPPSGRGEPGKGKEKA